MLAHAMMPESLKEVATGMYPMDLKCGIDKAVDGNGNYGFNAQTEEYGDMVKMGILDPTKVVRAALQNAASIAGLLITTEATVAEKPKKDDGPAMPPGVMGGMDGMMQGARATSSRTESPASSGAFLVRG